MSEIDTDNEKQDSEELKIPDVLPLLPVRDVVVYPFMIIPLFVGREMSVKAVDHALAGDRMILLATQHDIGEEEPSPDKIYEVGTVAMIMRMLKLPDGRVKILVQGLAKARITEYVSDKPFYLVRTERQNDHAAAGRIPGDRGVDTDRPGTAGQGDRTGQADLARGDGHPGKHPGPRQPGRPDRQQSRPEGGRCTGAAGDQRSARPPDQGQRAAQPGSRAAECPGQDPERGPRGDGQEPARVLPARADARHPAGTGRRRREGRTGRDQEGHRGRQDAGRGPQGGAQAAGAPGEHAPGRRRGRHHPHLPGLAGGDPLAQGLPRQSRYRPGREDPQRRPLSTWTRSRSASWSSWRCAS